jgi:hypothetical protein
LDQTIFAVRNCRVVVYFLSLAPRLQASGRKVKLPAIITAYGLP